MAAENNVGTLEIASFVTITGLPWGFKLLEDNVSEDMIGSIT